MPGALSAVVLQLYLQIKKALRIAFIQGALRKEIAQAHLGLGVHKDLTRDAAQSPKVLAFEVSGIAPTKNLHSHRIGAGRNKGRNVKFLRRFTVLTHPHLLTIYPYKAHRFYGTEMNKYLLTLPLLRHFKSPAVITDIVVLKIIDIGRIEIPMRIKLIAHIGINGVTKTLDFHIGRNGDLVPINWPKIRGRKTLQTVGYALYEFKIPGSV